MTLSLLARRNAPVNELIRSAIMTKSPRWRAVAVSSMRREFVGTVKKYAFPTAPSAVASRPGPNPPFQALTPRPPGTVATRSAR
jgi:hypothetical protein